nr:transposase [Thauera sp. K11]
MPPYAPELNPDEYLNRDLKTATRSGPIAKMPLRCLGRYVPAWSALRRYRHVCGRISAMSMFAALGKFSI